MADYPDYTSLMQIIGSDIMVPIDIQGAYIMMPVDLQAQYITLEIDIVAQTVGNLAVDINAQTIENIDIELNAQSIGLYIIRDWETKEDHDRSFHGDQTIAQTETVNLIDYTVPTGNLLYVDDFVVSGRASGTVEVKIAGTTIFTAYFDAEWPVCVTYTTPKKATAGEAVVIAVTNRGTSDLPFAANLGGRELTV